MNWNRKINDMIGAFKYTLITILVIYFLIEITASLPNSPLSDIKNLSSWISVIFGIVVGGVYLFRANYEKTMHQWSRE